MAAPAAAAASGLVVVCDQGVYEEMHPYERFAARDMVIDLAACGGRADDTAVAAMKAGREIPPPQVCVLVPHQLHLQAAALAKTGDNGEPTQPWAVHFKKVPQKLNEELNWFGTRIPSRIIIIQDDEDGDQAALRAQALLDLNDQEYEMQLKAGNRLVHSLEVMFSAVIQQEKEQQKLGQRSTILLLTKHDFILQTAAQHRLPACHFPTLYGQLQNAAAGLAVERSGSAQVVILQQAARTAVSSLPPVADPAPGGAAAAAAVAGGAASASASAAAAPTRVAGTASAWASTSAAPARAAWAASAESHEALKARAAKIAAKIAAKNAAAAATAVAAATPVMSGPPASGGASGAGASSTGVRRGTMDKGAQPSEHPQSSREDAGQKPQRSTRHSGADPDPQHGAAAAGDTGPKPADRAGATPAQQSAPAAAAAQHTAPAAAAAQQPVRRWQDVSKSEDGEVSGPSGGDIWGQGRGGAEVEASSKLKPHQPLQRGPSEPPKPSAPARRHQVGPQPASSGPEEGEVAGPSSGSGGSRHGREVEATSKERTRRTLHSGEERRSRTDATPPKDRSTQHGQHGRIDGGGASSSVGGGRSGSNRRSPEQRGRSGSNRRSPEQRGRSGGGGHHKDAYGARSSSHYGDRGRDPTKRGDDARTHHKGTPRGRTKSKERY